MSTLLLVAATLAYSHPALGAEAASWDAVASLAVSAPLPGLALVSASASDDPVLALDRLSRAGFRVAVALPPRLYYVLCAGAPAHLPAGFGYVSAPEGPIASEGFLAADVRGIDPFGGRPDALPPRRPSGANAPAHPSGASGPRNAASRAGALKGLPFGARWFDTSEFMIGRIAVSILFPESDGSLDTNRYDWTPALRDSVVRSAVRGLAKWSVFAARRGIDVTFAIEVHPGLATRYEPIDRTIGEEPNWIQDMLIPFVGYRADALTLCYDVANAARARLGAQWAALIFPIQNDTDPDGAFPDGYIAHSTHGGPYFVAPINNLNTKSATLDYYMAHEMGHTFWALDEGFGLNAWWACTLTAGYLDYPNYNSVIPAPGYCLGGTPPRQCLIYGNYPDSVCAYTEGQVGWADRNQDGTPDLLETRPIVNPDSSLYRATAGSPITLTGYALEIPLGNQNPQHFGFGDSISIATIDSVVVRVETGQLHRAAPIDGVFDSGREYFTVTLDPLPPGEYGAEWEAWNSSGRATIDRPITFIVMSAAAAPADMAEGVSRPKPSLSAAPVPSGGSIRFRLIGPPASPAAVGVYDVQGRLVASWRFRVPASGFVEWRWDGRVDGGAAVSSGLYFAIVETGAARVTRRLVISR